MIEIVCVGFRCPNSRAPCYKLVEVSCADIWAFSAKWTAPSKSKKCCLASHAKTLEAAQSEILGCFDPVCLLPPDQLRRRYRLPEGPVSTNHHIDTIEEIGRTYVRIYIWQTAIMC